MQSTIADRKLRTIELITRLEDEDLLSVVEELLQKSSEFEGDWGTDISEKDKSSILEGLEDLEKGRKVDYDDFKERIKKRFT